MKKIILSFLLFNILTLNAQSWNTIGNSGTNSNTNFIGTTDNQSLILKSNNKEGLRILPDGNVRIGANNDPVESTSNFRIYNNDLVFMELANSLGKFQIGKGNCVNCFAYGAKVGDAVIRNLGTSGNTILYITNDNNDGNTYIGIGDSANAIWAKFFNNRIFRVDGKIYSKEVEVKANVWADYVFKKDYQLKSLEEVEKHIVENGHLPNIPSAQEVKENGINVAEMDAKLLEKIEELTLYSIEQDKQIKNLQKENTELKKQSEKIEKLLSELSFKIER